MEKYIIIGDFTLDTARDHKRPVGSFLDTNLGEMCEVTAAAGKVCEVRLRDGTKGVLYRRHLHRLVYGTDWPSEPVY